MAANELICKLCNKEDAKWICNTCACDTTMCEKCKINHTEDKMTANHSVSMMNPGNNCDIHPGNVVLLFCIKCDVLVCVDCISGRHNEHRFLNISQVFNSKRTELIEIVENCSKKHEQNVKSKRSVEQNKEEYITSVNKSISDIKEENRKLKEDIDSITDKMVKSLENKKREVKPVFEQRIGIIEKNITTMKLAIETAKRYIEAGNAIGVIKVVSKLKHITEMMEQPFEQQKLIPPVFISGICKPKITEPFLGVIDDEDEKGSDFQAITDGRFKILIKSQFEPSDIHTCLQIAATMNGTAWITKQNELVLVDTKGNTKQKIDSRSLSLYSITVNSSNVLLLGMRDNISSLTQDINGKLTVQQELFFECKYGCIISTSNTGCILVFRYDGDFSYYWFNNKIESGPVKTISARGRHNTSPFQHSGFILKDDNDICVLVAGELEVFNTDLNHKFTYTGKENKLIKPFFNCLESDRNGNILLGDEKNSTVEIIDGAGKFIQFLMKKSDGLDKPMAMSMKVNGTLWVYSQGNGKIFVLEYSDMDKEETDAAKNT